VNKATVHRLLDNSGLSTEERGRFRIQIDTADSEVKLKSIYASIRRRTTGIPQHKG